MCDTIDERTPVRQIAALAAKVDVTTILLNLEWLPAMLCSQPESESRTSALANFAHAENPFSLSACSKNCTKFKWSSFFMQSEGYDACILKKL